MALGSLCGIFSTTKDTKSTKLSDRFREIFVPFVLFGGTKESSLRDRLSTQRFGEPSGDHE